MANREVINAVNRAVYWAVRRVYEAVYNAVDEPIEPEPTVGGV